MLFRSVSGGFTQAIRPLADFLGIERVEAVTLRFHPDGSYAGFDESCPTCKSKGKNVVARRLRAEHRADLVVMVGDGASDLEVKGDADKVLQLTHPALFTLFGGKEPFETATRLALKSLAGKYVVEKVTFGTPSEL